MACQSLGLLIYRLPWMHSKLDQWLVELATRMMKAEVTENLVNHICKDILDQINWYQRSVQLYWQKHDILWSPANYFSHYLVKAAFHVSYSFDSSTLIFQASVESVAYLLICITAASALGDWALCLLCLSMWLLSAWRRRCARLRKKEKEIWLNSSRIRRDAIFEHNSTKFRT